MRRCKNKERDRGKETRTEETKNEKVKELKTSYGVKITPPPLPLPPSEEGAL